MDFDKVLTFATQNLSEYFMVFSQTLIRPVIRFRPITDELVSDKGIIENRQIGQTGPQLSPKLFGFVVISIFLGTTINALIPNRKSGPDLVTSAIVILICWFLYSTILHLIRKFLGGAGTYLETLSVSLQLLSVLYVLSSLIPLLLSAVLKVPRINGAALSSGGVIAFFAEEPVAFYFIAHMLLLIVYLPIAIRYVHRFGWFRQALVAILSVIGTLFGIAFYQGFGTMSFNY